MKMAKVILRQEAINDLTTIWNYTVHKWSEKQSDKYHLAIKSVCDQIGKNPNIGKAYPEISKNLLGLKLGKHIVFYYQTIEYEIDVIRILHERMDLKYKIND